MLITRRDWWIGIALITAALLAHEPRPQRRRAARTSYRCRSRIVGVPKSHRVTSSLTNRQGTDV
jgi:hypothetical protein